MALMMDQLEFMPLHRKAAPAKRARHTFNFVVSGASLFVATGAVAFDMCGCVSHPRFEPELAIHKNVRSVNMLTSDVRNPSNRHRSVRF